MRKTIALCVALLVFKVGSAQEGKKDRLNHLDSLVNLSQEQKLAIEQIHLRYKDEIKELKSNPENNREHIHALHKERRAAVEKVLTNEQKAKLAAIKAERKKVRNEQGEKMKPFVLEERKKLETQLSEADKQAIAEARSLLKAQRKMHKTKGEKPKHRKVLPARVIELLAPIAEKYTVQIQSSQTVLQAKKSEMNPESKGPKKGKAEQWKYRFLLMKTT